eukprot:jgi/Chlat1/7772/Chrsp66S07330
MEVAEDMHLPHHRLAGCLRLLLKADGSVNEEATGAPLQLKRNGQQTLLEGLSCRFSEVPANGFSGSGGGDSILNYLYRLKTKDRVIVKYVFERHSPQETLVVVVVYVYIPCSLWEGHDNWKPSPAAAFVFSHLQPPSPAGAPSADLPSVGTCGVLGCKQHVAVSEAEQKQQFSLPALFRSLPCCLRDDSASVPSCREEEPSDKAGLSDLPADVLQLIMSRLGARDLRAAGAACKQFRSLSAAIVPGMLLKLHPHQRIAVAWMLKRERNHEKRQHPLYEEVVTADGLPYYLNKVNGCLTTEIPPQVGDFRGGLFCDEPGLGKTITGLALILKTKGCIAEPPPGVDVSYCPQRGESAACYHVLAGSSPVASEGRSSPRRGQPALNTDGSPRRHFAAPKDSSGFVTTPDMQVRKRSRLSGDSADVASSPTTVQSPTITATPPQIKRARSSTPRKCAVQLKFQQELPMPKPVHKVSVLNWLPVKVACEVVSDICTCAVNMNGSCVASGLQDGSPVPLGYVAVGDPQGAAKNINYFKSLLRQRFRFTESRDAMAVHWLLDQTEETLASRHGFIVPFICRTSSAYINFFRDLGLEAADSAAAVDSSTSDDADVHCWRLPEQLRDVMLDKEALQQALCATRVKLWSPSVSTIYLSRATLVVVPSTLITHWRAQIQRHTAAFALRVCILDTGECAPKVHELAWDYDIVLTTFSKLSMEWTEREQSPLLRVHWLRVILDEGHTLGASLAMTNKLQMACSLRCDRRWVMTGTPTPNTPSSQSAHLQPLLRFLREELYGNDSNLWVTAIQKPIEARNMDGIVRLKQVLQDRVICARKADIMSIPPCMRTVRLLDFGRQHAASYNQQVEIVKRNLLLADWNDPDHIESLLNSKKLKLCREMLFNVRLASCVAGHINVQVFEWELDETIDKLTERLPGLSAEEHDTIRDAVRNGGECLQCKQWSRLPVVTPCAHVLCLDCCATDKEHCALASCRVPYAMEMKKTQENSNPKWPVPVELIEWQPSYTQAAWHADWQSTASTKVDYLLQRLDVIQSQISHSGQSHKVIVFSQFLQHLHLIVELLKDRQMQFSILHSQLTKLDKKKGLATFEHDPCCNILLMDQVGALGFDLSFVTYVYLMEPIWDRSLEDQVISRAHRMGAKQAVMVETLAMRGTVEERMLSVLQGYHESSSEPASSGEGTVAAASLKCDREAYEANTRRAVLTNLCAVRAVKDMPAKAV